MQQVNKLPEIVNVVKSCSDSIDAILKTRFSQAGTFLFYLRSVSGMYMAIVSLSAIIVKVSKRKGPVGEKALVSIVVLILRVGEEKNSTNEER